MFTCLSPAKLNLFLYITGKRPDGYHNLQTLFVILDQGDVMHFELSPQDQVDLVTDFGFRQEDNLIFKAAMLLKAHTHCKAGIKISVDKQIPQGGGLGGGSSNAATTLLTLNRLWRLRLSERQLITLGAQLGADVPVFIKGTTCFAEGIGDELYRLDYPHCYYLVATPQGCKVPTRELFAAPELKRDSVRESLETLLNNPFENAFTQVVCKRYPQVQNLLTRLNLYGRASMSGSGSSCFVPFDSSERAQAALISLQQDRIPCFVAHSVTISPVLTALESAKV